MASLLFDPQRRHVAKVILAAGFILVWLGGCDYFFNSSPEVGVPPSRAEGMETWIRGWAALYTPAVWLDRMLGAWLDEPESVADRLRLLTLAFAQVVPLLALLVGGWPRAAVWREWLVAYAMIWVCLAVAGFIQLCGGITVFDS